MDQPSQKPNPYHSEILNRLSNLPKIDQQQPFYSKIRINSNAYRSNGNIKTFDQFKIESIPRKSTVERMKPDNSRIKIESNLSTQKKTTYTKTKNKFQHSTLNETKKHRPTSAFTVVEEQSANIINSENSKLFNKPVSKYIEEIKRGRAFSANIAHQKSQPNLKERIKGRLSQQRSRRVADSPSQSAKKIKASLQVQEEVSSATNRLILKKLDVIREKPSRNQTIKTPEDISKRELQNSTQQKHGSHRQSNHSKSSRFNAISVFDHLYADSEKLDSKRKVEKLIEEKYKRSTTLTFHPELSKRSVKLAESRFQQQKIAQSQKNESVIRDGSPSNLEVEACQKRNCYNSDQIDKNKVIKGYNTDRFSTVQERIIKTQKQKMGQKLRMVSSNPKQMREQRKTLMKLFLFLSGCLTSQAQVDSLAEVRLEQTVMEQYIEALPLALIQSLDPLIKKVYQRVYLDWEAFLQEFKTNRELQFRRAVILASAEKFLKRLDAAQI